MEGTMDNQTEQNFLRLVTVEVTQAIAQALETLIHEKGFEVPIYMAAIGSNGYTYAVKYQQEAEGTALEAKELAEHAPDEEGARFPQHVIRGLPRKRSARSRQRTDVGRKKPTLTGVT
jgi:hypothetical protein